MGLQTPQAARGKDKWERKLHPRIHQKYFKAQDTLVLESISIPINLS